MQNNPEMQNNIEYERSDSIHMWIKNYEMLRQRSDDITSRTSQDGEDEILEESDEDLNDINMVEVDDN